MQAWQATVQDDRGNAVPNPVVSVYQADGTTLATVYNEAGATLANPVAGNIDGFVKFYAPAGKYKVESAGGETWDVSLDGIFQSYSAALSANKAGLDYVSAVVGGRLVEWVRRSGAPCLGGGWDAAGVRTVLHYGAQGDGTTDDLAAFNAAVSHLGSMGGGELRIPSGTFRLSGRWVIASNYITIKGAGRLATQLNFAGASGSGVTIGTVFYPDVSGFTVLNAGGTGFEAGSFPVGPQANLAWGRIADIEVAQSGGDGFFFRNMFMMDISGLRSQNAGGYGFNWDGPSDSGTKTSLNVRACHAVQAALGGHRIKNICYSEFTSMGADRCGGYGYHLENLQDVRVHGGCEQAALSAVLCHYDAADSDLLDSFKGVTISIWEKDSHWNGTAVVENAAYGKLATFTSANNTARCGGVTFEQCSNYNQPTVAKNIRVIGGNWNIVAMRGLNPGMNKTVNGGSFSTFARDANAVSNGLNISVTAANTPIATLHPALRNEVLQYGGRITVCAVRSALTSSSKSATYELLVNRGVGGTFIAQLGAVGSTSGAESDECSFTFSIDPATNRLLATPVGVTTGNFYFHFHCSGNLDIDYL